MRIAYVNANYQINHMGGGHVHMEQFIRNAIELGHAIWVYPGNNYPGTNQIPIHRYEHIKSLRKMDVLYVRLENRSPEICKWVLPPRRWLYNFPLVVWEFNTLPNELDTSIPPKENEILKNYSRGCDLAVCVSPSLAEVVSQHLDVKHVVAISNGSDPDMFSPEIKTVERLRPFKDNFNVVWIGTFKEKWHDLETIGNAAMTLWQDVSTRNILFHLIGEGLSAYMGGMPPNVFYWGGEKYTLLPNWLSGMDVGLSLYKPGKSSFNSPLKVFDYMSSALSVVSTKHPLVSDILFQLGASDLVIDHGDSEKLAQILRSLFHDRDRVKRLGKSGRQMIVDKYNWKRSISATLDKIQDLLDQEKRNHL